jgi:hypothetical protein
MIRNMEKFSLLTLLFMFCLFLSGCQEQQEVVPSANRNLSEMALLAISAADDTQQDKPACGNPGSVKPINTVDLPSMAVEFIRTRFEGSSIVRAGQTDNRSYLVQVKKPDGSLVVLMFDPEGRFVPRMESQNLQWKFVTADQIPDAVKTFVRTAFPGASVISLAKDQERRIKVELKGENGTVVILLFDPAGTFIARRIIEIPTWKPVTANEVNERIRYFINTRFPQATIEKAMQSEGGHFRLVIKTTEGYFVGLAFDSKGVLTAMVRMKE